MNLEQQVTSLEISKKLKELGVKQKSLFYHYQKKRPKNPNMHEFDYCQKDQKWCLWWKPLKQEGRLYRIYSAFTVAELGGMLPNVLQIEDGGSTVWLEIIKITKWEVQYVEGSAEPIFKKQDESEANARGKMLIYLLENKLI